MLLGLVMCAVSSRRGRYEKGFASPCYNYKGLQVLRWTLIACDKCVTQSESHLFSIENQPMRLRGRTLTAGPCHGD
eukprot:s4571_g2.t1